ncbi:MAG: hypothetical protein G3I10_03115 [Ferrovum sp.]|nr:hypothetical protein [Ferrovum sp.]
MHQLMFAAFGTILTMLWGFGFSVIADKFDNGLAVRSNALASLWALGQFLVIFFAISLGA